MVGWLPRLLCVWLTHPRLGLHRRLIGRSAELGHLRTAAIRPRNRHRHVNERNKGYKAVLLSLVTISAATQYGLNIELLYMLGATISSKQ